MPLSLDLDVIDGFRAVARNLANHLYNADFPGNYFRADALNAQLPAYEIGDTLICFCTSEHAKIIFSDIQPIDIVSMEVGTPVRFNEQETSVSLKTWNNAGSTPIPQTWNAEEEEKITQAREILTEIATAIRAKVGGGGPVFQASLEAELSAKLNVNLKTQEERRILNQEKMELVVPPWTSTSLTQRQSIADVRQKISMRCLIDSRISLLNHGPDWNWEKHFVSVRELGNYIKGGGGGTGEHSDGLDSVVNTRQFQSYETNLDHLIVDIEQEKLSRNVRTGEITRKDTPIEMPATEKRRNRKRRKRKGKKDAITE